MKRIAVGVALLACLGLSGCALQSEAAGIATKTVTLDNGGTVECVLASASSGTTTLDCIEGSYVAP